MLVSDKTYRNFVLQATFVPRPRSSPYDPNTSTVSPGARLQT